MTREQAREAAAVMLAWADGKEVEFKYPNEVECKYPHVWDKIDNPNWCWDKISYRIKPTAKLRPWTADEVPVGCQIRSKANTDYRMLIDRTANHGVREDWLKSYEHSTDGGKTWLPCGVMEEKP